MANALGATPAEKGVGPALQKGEEDLVSGPTENKAYVLEAIDKRVNGQVGVEGEVAVDGVTVRVDAAEGSGENPLLNRVATATGGWLFIEFLLTPTLS